MAPISCAGRRRKDRSALALVAEDPIAAQMLADARRLHDALVELMQPEPVTSADVGGALRRIRGGNDDATAMGPPTWRLTAWVAAAAVLCLAIGFTVGMTASPSDSDEAIATLMFGTTPIPAGGLL